MNKTNIAESRAGVNVVGLDFEGDSQVDEADDDSDAGSTAKLRSEDSQEAAMSQLAAMITSQESPKSKKSSHKDAKSGSSTEGKNSKRQDPVQAILASAGVQYTHDNAEVIGSSKIEGRLSRRAERADPTAGADMDAQVFLPESQSFVNGTSSKTDAGGQSKRSNATYRYRPPDFVKKRQFCTMAKWAGETDAVSFATKVEGWTQAERREFLEKFYTWRKQVLEGKGGDQTKIVDEKQAHEEEFQITALHRGEQEGGSSLQELEGGPNRESAATDAHETTDDEDDDDEL